MNNLAWLLVHINTLYELRCRLADYVIYTLRCLLQSSCQLTEDTNVKLSNVLTKNLLILRAFGK
jgi:hypothetical protein